MCIGPDKNKQLKAQAEERDRVRRYAHAGRNLAYTNTSRIVQAAQKDVSGLIRSRNMSDLAVGLETQKGNYLKTKEAYTISMLKDQVTGVGAKGGTMSRQSMLRGGTKAEKYFSKIQKAEVGYELARTRGKDILLEKQRRNQMALNESLRAQQGLPPSFGVDTRYVPVPDTRFMSTLATGLGIAAQFTPAGPLTNILKIGSLTSGAAV